MIELYTWTTPNGRKISILLEELGLPYEVHEVNTGAGDQHKPAFLAISPNNKIPAIRDRDTGETIMESGAIMLWLAEREGRFLGAPSDRGNLLEWLMWQMSGFGPVLGTMHGVIRHGRSLGEAGDAKFAAERDRLYRVLDRRLTDRDFVVGAGRGTYTIADMAIWPWASRYEWHGTDLNDYPAVLKWYRRLAERPAVQRGYHVPRFVNEVPAP